MMIAVRRCSERDPGTTLATRTRARDAPWRARLGSGRRATLRDVDAAVGQNAGARLDIRAVDADARRSSSERLAKKRVVFAEVDRLRIDVGCREHQRLFAAALVGDYQR